MPVIWLCQAIQTCSQAVEWERFQYSHMCRAEMLMQGKRAHQDTGEDLWVLCIRACRAVHILQVAVQERSHHSHIVAHQRPHD